MGFFKPVRSLERTKSTELEFLEQIAAKALSEKAPLWQTLEMLRAVSVSLAFVDKKLVFMRQGIGRYLASTPRARAPSGELIWHLLGNPGTPHQHDQSMRHLAVDLAWYRASRYLPNTPPEIKEIVYFYGPSLSPALLYEIVTHDFRPTHDSWEFSLMLRQFKTSITDPENFLGWDEPHSINQ